MRLEMLCLITKHCSFSGAHALPYDCPFAETANNLLMSVCNQWLNFASFSPQSWIRIPKRSVFLSCNRPLLQKLKMTDPPRSVGKLSKWWRQFCCLRVLHIHTEFINKVHICNEKNDNALKIASHNTFPSKVPWVLKTSFLYWHKILNCKTTQMLNCLSIPCTFPREEARIKWFALVRKTM